MNKIKSINWNNILKLLKCALVGIVATLIGTVIFAFVLKFANLTTALIGHINNLIKVASIFVMVTCVKRCLNEKIMLHSIFAGIIYAILSFIVFSIANGSFVLDLSFLYDFLFVVIVSVIISVIINLISKKSV